MDDPSLVERFIAGDETAVRDLYRRYAGPVLTVGVSLLGRRDLAAEVVQTTFLNAWRAAPRFDGSRDLGPWLYAIARRAAIDVYRRENRHARPSSDLPDVAVLPVSFESTWEAFEVRRAVDELPPDERAVVRLAHFEGLTHAEIAARLGVPLGTVKSRSHRAHAHLTAALAHLAPNDVDDGTGAANRSPSNAVMTSGRTETESRRT